MHCNKAKVYILRASQGYFRISPFICTIWIWTVIQTLAVGQNGFADPLDIVEVQFKHLTSDNGLAHNRVHCAIMDDQGYMWFGTQDGLSRWDGSSIKTYYPRLNDSTAISGSLVTDIEKDKNGFLWIVSHQGDLCRYDPRTDLFKTFHYPEFDDGIVITSEMEIFFDSEDVIWIGCYDDGFIRFDPVSQVFKRYDVIKSLSKDDDRVRKNSVLVIEEDRYDKNLLWLGTNNGLYSFNKLTQDVSSHSDVNVAGGAPAVRSIHIDKAGKLWIATLGSGIGEYSRESGSWSFHVPNREMWLNYNYGVNFIHDMEYKSENEYWISSAEKGSGIFNVKTKEFDYFRSETKNQNSIASGQSYKVYTDPFGRVWWMHLDEGVSYMEPECQIFHFENFQLDGSESSWNRFLADFTFDKKRNKIYGVGHVKNGLFEIDHEKGEYNRIPKLGFEDNMNAYDAVLMTSIGDLLVGGFNYSDASYGSFKYSPLLFLDTVIGKLRPYKIELFDALQDKNINDIVEDSSSNIWIATDDGFLFRFNLLTNELDSYFMNTKHGTGINYIEVSNKGHTLYLATFDGIHSFNINDKSFKVLNETQEFSSRGVALSKSEDFLWIGTRQLGVQCYDIKNEKLLSINGYRNAPRTPVEKVFVDREERLWATTERGIYLLDPVLEAYYDFGSQSGVPQDFFYAQGVFELEDGTILLGQQGGYYHFQPEDVISSLNSGKTIITDLLVNQNEINKDRDSQGNFNLNLPYDENSISIGFSSISYCNQDKVSFIYRLDGLEEDWIVPLNNNRTINYPSLTSGNYTFLVKKIGEDDDQLAQVSIRINPPFWRSWWAYLIYTCVFFYGVNWFFSLKLKRQHEKEAIRTKISSDIHDDVGSLLTGLAMQSETMALDYEGIEKEELLEISELGREAIDRLRDIVWVLDSRGDRYENLIDRMKHFADTIFRSTNFKYNFDVNAIDVKKYIEPDTRQNIYLIFKEAITNLVKHSNGTKADIEFTLTKKIIRLRIYDNGDSNEILKSEGLGLKNMNMRAEKIGGKLQIKHDKGFEVILEVDTK